MNNVLFSALWIGGTSIGLGLVTYSNRFLGLLSWESHSTDILAICIAWLTVGLVQGAVLFAREKQFFWSWAITTTVLGLLSVYVTMAVSLALMMVFVVGMVIGPISGGAVLGFGYSLILRKLPRAKTMIWVSAIALCAILPHFILMTWQVGDPHTANPENWVRPVMIESAIASTIQVVGLLHVLERKEPFPQESELLARRPLVALALYEPTGKIAFYSLWIGGTLLGIGLCLFNEQFIYFSPLAIAVFQGLTLSRWFRRYRRWMLFTVIGGFFGGLIGSTISLPIAMFGRNIVLASFLGCSVLGISLGLAHQSALRGFPKARQIFWVDTLTTGLLMPLVLIAIFPSSDHIVSGSVANVLATVAAISAIALQGAGLLHVLKSGRTHNRESYERTVQNPT